MARRFLRALRGAVETKSLPSGVPVMAPEVKRVYLDGGYHSATLLGQENRAAYWDMDTVITEGYERSVWVFRCVELQSGHASRLPFRLGRNVGTDMQETALDHPLYRVMNGRANPLERSRHFRKRLSAQVLLSKRGAFVEKTRNRAGVVTRLDLLDPSRTRPVPSNDGTYLSHFEYVTLMGEVRELDPSRVLWIREPHPTDMFSGVTPLEAAGISIDLDHLSRLYNVNFIKNDSKPGGIVAVDTESLTDQEADRVEAKFAPGVHQAGELAVVATGPGGIRYIDTSTRPRDMAYSETSRTSKMEILAAFGIGESLLGNASEKSFQASEQEEFNFWTGPMPPHLELIADAFADDADDWDPYLDTSSVDVLELRRRKARQEAREEFNQGLRSISEYRPLASLPEIDTAHTRALWISPAKAPVAARPEDAAALGLAVTDPNAPGAAAPGTPGGLGPGGEPMGAAGALPGGEDGAAGGDAAAAVAGARESGAGGDAASAVAEARGGEQEIVSGDAAGVVAAGTAVTEIPEGDGAAAVLAAMQTKAISAADEPESADNAPEHEDDGGEDEAQRAELAVAAALDALLARQQQVIAARLESPKARKGTAFWQPPPEEPQPLAAATVVQAERWQQEVQDTLAPIAQTASAEAGTAILSGLVAAGLLAPSPNASWLRFAGVAGAGAVLSVLDVAAQAMGAFLGRLASRIDGSAVTATDVTVVVDDMRAYYTDQTGDFVRGVAEAVAVGTVNGAREGAVAALSVAGQPGVKPRITRQWVSKRDERVRDAHRELDGQILPVGEPFRVDGSSLRWPRDPIAPLHLTINCRCRARYRFTPGQRLTTNV